MQVQAGRFDCEAFRDLSADAKELDMISRNLRSTRWILAAGLTFGAIAAQAASGVTVTRTQAIAVAAGMTSAEVQQILGRPAYIAKYRSEPGPTWTYHVVGTLFGTTAFEVDFDSDGTVTSARERIVKENG
jgi:hypothetical protein